MKHTIENLRRLWRGAPSILIADVSRAERYFYKAVYADLLELLEAKEREQKRNEVPDKCAACGQPFIGVKGKSASYSVTRVGENEFKTESGIPIEPDRKEDV